MKTFGSLLVVTMLLLSPRAEAFPEDLANKWDARLTKHVKTNGGFDYQGFATDQAELDAFIIAHATLDPSDKNGGAGTWIAQFVSSSARDRDWKIKHLKDTFNDRGKISLKLSSDFDFHYDWRINDIRNK